MVGVLCLFGPASVARAESVLWTLTASPLAATTGASTIFTLTATNADPAAALLSSSEIGCVVLDVPANFTTQGAVVTGSNSGGSWHVDSVVGNRVTVHADSGGDRLEYLGWVRFTVTATGQSTGSLAWGARAYRQQDCSGTGALLGVPPVIVVTGATVTPTPGPTPILTPLPTPTPKPTLAPTPAPTPTPLLPLPLPLPSIGILPTPTPTPTPNPAAPTPTPRSAPTPSALEQEPAPQEARGGTPAATPPTSQSTGAVPTPSPSGSDGAPAAVPSILGAGTVNGEPGAALPRIGFEADEIELGLGTMGLMEVAIVWIVPAASFAGPGLLLLIVVAVQATGALAWVPAVRRLRGEDEAIPA